MNDEMLTKSTQLQNLLDRVLEEYARNRNNFSADLFGQFLAADSTTIKQEYQRWLENSLLTHSAVSRYTDAELTNLLMLLRANKTALEKNREVARKAAQVSFANEKLYQIQEELIGQLLGPLLRLMGVREYRLKDVAMAGDPFLREVKE